jgi:AcrR family transcriptional regulator
MTELKNFADLKKQERENRKSFILDVAAKVFAERPFNQVTMRNIAKETGVTPTAIYRYFPDKHTLFAEIYIKAAKEVIKEIYGTIENSNDFCIEEVAVNYISHFHSADQHLKIIMQFMLDDSISNDLWENINLMNRLFSEQIEILFKKYNSSIESKILAQSFIASLNGILLSAKNHPKKSDEEILEHMKRLTILIAQLFKDKILMGRK